VSQDKVFFTCIGAQKAGTSWLQSYLSKNENVYLPRIKEMHFFDSLCLSENLVGDFWMGAFKERCVKALRKSDYKLAADYIDRLDVGGDKKKYQQYYLKRGKGFKVFGDITPAYSMLDRQGFEEIRSIFPAAKIIFILRNPVERYWSFLRMQLKKNSKYPLEKKFYDVIGNDHVVLRSDYERTMRSVDSVFPATQVLYVFYEDLFGERHKSVVNSIDSFLGLESSEGDFLQEKINSSQAVAMSKDMRIFAANEFKSTYYYVEEKMGYVPLSWQKDKNLFL
jgi:hypothetical protein